MKLCNNAIGYFLGLLLGIIFAYYMYSLHEGQLWFSNIRKIEQEISLRTESGLYYSYYKEILQKKDLIKGIYALTNDTKTEWPRSINIMERFNIYQEILLASLLIKYGLNITEDTHIWTFVKAKLGYSYDEVTFETALYLCHGAFTNLDGDFFTRTTRSGVMPLYLITVAIEILILGEYF
uniref:D-alanyl-D-alanine carboxypeptidase n=1 Tax=Strongyloides stercoralis TaxID=6248 RepID=A0A0K0E1E3_STRER